MQQGDAARTYHALTSLDPGRDWFAPVADARVMQDFVHDDMDRRPSPAKAYSSGLPVSPLPRDLPTIETPATTVLAGQVPAGHGVLDLGTLARVLYLSAGVVRVAERPQGRIFFRAAGSAGGRFPLEVYVAARSVQGLDDGVHWYDPIEHALVRIGPPPGGTTTTLVVTGVPWRTGWRYAERGYRHLYWDAGTLLAQQQLLAASAGVRARLRTVFPDATVARLVGADGVHEFPLALLTLGDGDPAVHPGGEAAPGSVDGEGIPLEFPLVTQTQRAGDGDLLGAPEPAGDPLPAAIEAAAPPSASLDEVILRRGSTRLMVRGAALPRTFLDFAMAAALRGISEPHFVAVHAVDDVRPGLYRWPDLAEPVRAGDLRDEMTRVCADQDLGGDASFVVLSCADLSAIDDRGYRAAQLRAGLVSGRLHLAAYALGAGASGMTFADSEIAALLGEPLAALLFTCVGVPEYRNRPGGRPGRPTTVRVVTPRFSD
jgi:hypothetical protein